MPYPRIERREFRFAPSGGGTTELYRIPPGWRCFLTTARVVVVQDGNGTVTVGRSGDTDGLLLSADIGPTVLGKKITPTGVDLAGNGRANTVEEILQAVYTVGTNTIHPVLTITIAMMREETFLDLMTQ